MFLIPLPPQPVSGYEFCTVFTAGVEPNSPPRDKTNCLSTPFSRSVESRWRLFWLRILSTRCAFSRANLVPVGGRWPGRGRWHCRGKPGRAPYHVQAYLGTLYRASKAPESARGWKEARSSTSKGARELMMAQTSGFQTEKLISGRPWYSVFLLDLTKSGERASF